MVDLTNILLLTDSYKVSHHKQYPPRTEGVFSYFESRGGEFPVTVFFGLQYLVKRHFSGVRVTPQLIDEAEQLFREHFFGDTSLFHRPGWQHIIDKHGGRLPVRVRAVPEGSVIPVSNVLLTIENTDPACYWLTNYLETLLVQVWYPCTVATQSRSMKQVVADYLERTGDPAGLLFKLHDFGFRGVSSVETAALGGAAHLVNFTGTDNVAGLWLAREYYGARMPGFSIPAAEHSTITSWGREREADAYHNMLEQFPKGFVAVVSDSYDIFHACSQIWGKELKDAVLRRDGTLVVRPDSGDPPRIVTQVLNLLGEAFGFTVNAKGYRVLDSHIRVIQGDGIDKEMLGRILQAISEAKWSADNLAFGSGGGLLQKLNRDTCKFAFKCSSAVVDGREVDVFKQPATDQGKRSKAGRLKLVRRGEALATIRKNGQNHEHDLLEDVFLDGRLVREEKWDNVVARAALDSGRAL